MRKGMFVTTLVAFAFSSVIALAATPGDEVPFREGEPMPPAPPGLSWCLIQKPAVYDTITETVTVRPAANFQVPVPGEYSTRTETVPAQPAYRVGRVIPAQLAPKSITYVSQEEYTALEVTDESGRTFLINPEFTEVAMDVEVAPAYDQITIVPAQFRDVPKRLVVEPARKSFQRVTCDDGNLCWTVCDTPAKYRDIVTKELVADATEQRTRVPAQMGKIMVRKPVRPAQIKEVRVPAKQSTYTRQEVVTAPRVEWQTVAATTQTVQVMVETKAPSFTSQAIPEKKESISRRVLKTPATMVWRLQANTYAAPAPAPVVEAAPIPAPAYVAPAPAYVAPTYVAPAAAVESEYGSVPGAGASRARYSLK